MNRHDGNVITCSFNGAGTTQSIYIFELSNSPPGLSGSCKRCQNGTDGRFHFVSVGFQVHDHLVMPYPKQKAGNMMVQV